MPVKVIVHGHHLAQVYKSGDGHTEATVRDFSLVPDGAMVNFCSSRFCGQFKCKSHASNQDRWPALHDKTVECVYQCVQGKMDKLRINGQARKVTFLLQTGRSVTATMHDGSHHMC